MFARVSLEFLMDELLTGVLRSISIDEMFDDSMYYGTIRRTWVTTSAYTIFHNWITNVWTVLDEHRFCRVMKATP